MIVLAEFEPLDPVLGERVILRASSANDRNVTGLNNLIWYPAISTPPVVAINLFKGDFDGTASPSGGGVVLEINKFERDFPDARRYVWQGCKVRFWAGNSGQAWPWNQVFEGIVDLGNYTADNNKITLTLVADLTPFDKDVLTLKYLGTGGAEGDVSLKNRPKPFLLGRCSNVEPFLIDGVKNVYQFSAYGPIQAVTKLYERASEFPASTGDYATYAALIAATIPNGNWATCLAEGLIRLGAPAFGVITGDVDGDKFGGVWRRKTGEIVQRIASNAGILGSIVDTVSWDALDDALTDFPNQGRIGYFISDQVKVIECAAELAAPCNAQAGVTLLGKLFATRIVVDNGTLVLDAQRRQLPRVMSSSETGSSPPFSYLKFSYNRAWRVHTDDEIALGSTSIADIITAISTVDDDGILTIDEKIRIVIPESSRLEAAYQGILATANALGIAVTALTTARAAWLGLRDGLSPAWNDTSQNSPITRTDWDSILNTYRMALEDARVLIAAPASVTVVPPPAQLILRDEDEIPLDGQFPRTLIPVVKRGAVDIRDDDDVSYSISASGITATVNNTAGSADKGKITVTGGGVGSIQLTITIAGVVFGPYAIAFTVRDELPGGVISLRSETASSIAYQFTIGGVIHYRQVGSGSIGGNATANITFPIPFTTKAFFRCSGGPTALSKEGDVHNTSNTLTAGSIANSSDATCNYCWSADGY